VSELFGRRSNRFGTVDGVEAPSPPATPNSSFQRTHRSAWCERLTRTSLLGIRPAGRGREGREGGDNQAACMNDATTRDAFEPINIYEVQYSTSSTAMRVLTASPEISHRSHARTPAHPHTRTMRHHQGRAAAALHPGPFHRRPRRERQGEVG
jgi:hypothetical protein